MATSDNLELLTRVVAKARQKPHPRLLKDRSEDDERRGEGAGGCGGDGSQVELLMLRKTLKVKMLLLTIPIVVM